MTLCLEIAIILFDWKKIYRFSKGQPSRVILALRALTGETPIHNYDPLYFAYIKDFTGKSFLVNPERLIEESFFYKAKEIAEYIALASFRSYADYTMTNNKTLDLLHVPVRQELITNNRLLSIEDGKVLFKFEEVTEKTHGISL